jgi:hypothetical protein
MGPVFALPDAATKENACAGIGKERNDIGLSLRVETYNLEAARSL